MPQRPTMPSPHMVTVDVEVDDVLDFSVTIDSRDTIVDCDFNIYEYKSNEVAISEKWTTPKYYIKSETYYDYFQSKVDFYKENQLDIKYTIIVTPTKKDVSSNPQSYDWLSAHIGYEKKDVKKIIFKIPYATSKNNDIFVLPKGYFSGFIGLEEIVFDVADDIKIHTEGRLFNNCGETLSGDFSKITKFSPETFNRSPLIKTGVFLSLDVIPDGAIKIAEKLEFKEHSNDYIPSGKFKDCKNLKSVTFPDNRITSIKNECFKNCENLKTINGISGLEIIESDAFYNCSSLENFFSVSNKIKTIVSNAFKNSGITKIYLNNDCGSLGEEVFYGCNNLQWVEFDGLVNTLKSPVFEESENVINVYIKNIEDINTFCESVFGENWNNYVSLTDGAKIFDIAAESVNGGDILTYHYPTTILKNDKEYYWNMMLTDSYGKRIKTPNYYFKTRTSPIVKINRLYEEKTEKLMVTKEDTTNVLFTKEIIARGFAFSFEEENVENDEKKDITYITYDNTITKSVEYMIECTSTNTEDGEFPAFELKYTPTTTNSDGQFMVSVSLLTENGVDDSGNKTYIIEEAKTLYLTKLQGEANIYYADETSIKKSGIYLVSYDTYFQCGKHNITYHYQSDKLYSHTNTFRADYEVNNTNFYKVPIKSSRWKLYEVIAGKKVLIDDTGILFNPQSIYVYNCFVSNKKYYLCYEIENEDGVVATDAFNFSTAETFGNDMIYRPEIKVNKNENAVEIKLYNATMFYAIVRVDVNENTYRLIASDIRGGGDVPRFINDLTAASNTEYYYFIVGKDLDGNEYSYISPSIIPRWDKTSIIGFNGNHKDNSPLEIDEDDRWLFGLSMGEIQYTQNLSKTASVGVGCKYAHMTSGKTNYDTFIVTGLIGDIDCLTGEYCDDTPQKIKKWKEFISSPVAKLVIDTKGNVKVCDAISSLVLSKDGFREQPTSIEAEFIEIASPDKVSLYSIKDGE